jgi:alanine racemase
VLSPLLESEIPEAVAHRLEPTVVSLEFARRLSEVSRRHGQPTRVHVEVDTGMGRTGIDPEETLAFLEAISKLEGVRVGSLYTHLPEADAEDASFAFAQGSASAPSSPSWRRKACVRRSCARRTARPPFASPSFAPTSCVGLAAYGHYRHPRQRHAVGARRPSAASCKSSGFGGLLHRTAGRS